MKYTFLLFMGFSILASPAMAQNPSTRLEQTTGIDYYLWLGVDFEIKDNPNPDPDIIRSIPFETYHHQRHATVDQEITDSLTNYVIILYSEERCRLNKQ